MARTVAERQDVVPVLVEVFREHGYAAASLALIGKATGLGKGSLYHFFPNGKEDMAAAVLAHIDGWFETHVFAPLRDTEDPAAGIRAMLAETDAYFRSGRRACLVGIFALGDARDRFAEAIRSYFRRWEDGLRDALVRAGHEPAEAAALAEDAVAAIQGALVLARAHDDPGCFARTLDRLAVRMGLAAAR